MTYCNAKFAKRNRICSDRLVALLGLHSIMPTRYLSREELGKISAWANREFYRKPERIERIRHGYTSPYLRMKFETYQAAAHLIDQ